MDLTNMVIELKVQGAYSRGGIPLNVQGVANVKVSSKTDHLANAIERFLSMSREQIMAIARETLEGNLRGVLSTLTPEEVNQDREKFAGELVHEADHDLARLGLELDTLKIQHVSDDKGYLESIGRRQTAELLKKSRIAEAENHALSQENAASNLQSQEIAKVEAEINMARAEGQRRIAEAQTRKGALIAESRGQVQALLAKANAEVDVQKARLAQVRFQLVADKVKPAEARKSQMVAQARGAAAKIVEDGKASASAIRSLAETWGKAGDSARQIFVAQKLQGLINTMMSTVGDMPIDKITVIDRELAANGSNFAVKAAVTAEQIKQMMGIDLAGIAQRAGGAITPTAALPAGPRPRPPTNPGPGKPPGT
jgi:flotillin